MSQCLPNSVYKQRCSTLLIKVKEELEYKTMYCHTRMM